MDDSTQDTESVDAESFELTGTIKWFSTIKGFGFIAPIEGGDDVFLHLSALRQAGYEAVDQGATVVCEVAQRPKGLQVVRILNLDVSTAEPVAQRPMRSSMGGVPHRHPPIVPEGEFFDATVKWFNPSKGYGFITQGEGTPDIFIHMETLRRVGIPHLRRGQAVRVRIGQGPKGPQVAEIDTE